MARRQPLVAVQALLVFNLIGPWHRAFRHGINDAF
jgi:hypothetical protein